MTFVFHFLIFKAIRNRVAFFLLYLCYKLIHKYMFVLRKTDADGIVENQSIGSRYFLIGTGNPERFKDIYKDVWNENPDEKSQCFAFICGEVAKPIPLFKGNWYYIMSESGSTFEKLPFITV